VLASRGAVRAPETHMQSHSNPPKPASGTPPGHRLLVALVWLPALLVLLPVAVVLWRAAEPAGDIWQQVVENRLPGYLWQTVVLVTAVTLVAVVCGVPAAWLVSVHDFPGRKWLEWLLLLPLAMPGFVAAAAYVDTLQNMIPVYIWIRETWGIEAFLWSQQITPWIFAVGVLGTTLFPYVFLSCRAVFSREAAGSLEAARLLGSGGLRVFRCVALPMARPAVAAGCSLVAMEAINDYGVVSHFGLTPLTPGIFRVWGEGYVGVAMRLAAILMVFVMLGLAVERWQRGRRKFAPDPSDARVTRRRLGPPGVLLAWLACGLPLAIGFAIPAVRMTRWAWQARETTDLAATLDAAVRSFTLAGGAAVFILLGAVLLVSGGRAFKSGGFMLARRIGVMGYAFPSALVAVGVGAWISTISTSLPALALSASAVGLVTAYFIRFLAVGIQPVAAGFARVSPRLHEAARTLGAGPLRALAQVDLPLVRPALLAGATLAFIDVFKELPLTLVLRPFDFETLATLTFRLTDESRIPEAAVPGLLLVLFSLIGLIPLTRMLRHASR
jgi:iron(III) transport system permease protein